MSTKKVAKVSKSYNVTGRVHADVGLDISALNMEDALTKSKELKLQDFVEILGDHQDSSAVEIRSVWVNDDNYL